MKIILLTILLINTLLANIAIVSAFTGKASIQRCNDTVSVSIGTKIEKDDILITQNNTKLQLLFNDDTMITIGKNAKFSILEYVFDEQIAKKSEAKFNFVKGFFRTVTGKIGKLNPEKFNIKIKSASLGIRGTRFDVFVSENIIKTSLFQGEIFLLVNNSMTTLLPGQMAVYELNKGVNVMDGVLKESRVLNERDISNLENIKQKYYDAGNTIIANIENIINNDDAIADVKNIINNDDIIYDIELLSQHELDGFLIGDTLTALEVYRTPTSVIGNKQNTASYSGDIVGKYISNIGGISDQTGKIDLTLDFTNQKVSGKLSNISGDASKFNTNILNTNSQLNNESFNSKSFSNTNIKEGGIVNGYYYGANGKIVGGGIALEHTDNSRFSAGFIGKEK
jgi:hypothetical protein